MKKFPLTAALTLGLAALVLAGCSQATADSQKPAAVVVPTTIKLDFKSAGSVFESADSWAADSADLTAGEQTINVYAGSHGFTPAKTVDLSKATSFTVDVKGDVKVNTASGGNSGWWFSGFRVVLIDNTGKKFDFKDFADTTDFNNTAFTTVTRTFTETGATWESSGTGDLSQIVKVVIYTNYNQGSLVLKNFQIQ